MAVYAIGDIQGCYDDLRASLDQVGFDPATDRLWLTGDLVNRGPDSLAVLRFVRALGESAVCVLGNHDLHLLAMDAGNREKAGKDTLDQVLAAPDREELLDWLRQRPLLHLDPALGYALIHAGLPPQWTIARAAELAHEVEQVLRGDRYRDFFAGMYGNKPRRWDDQLQGMERLRFITNCLTRLRFCSADGRLGLKEKGPPGTQQAKSGLPWFEHPHRASRDTRILFGHWSTLGYVANHNVWALDTGCLWGGDMTLLQIDREPPEPTFVPCPGTQDPNQFA